MDDRLPHERPTRVEIVRAIKRSGISLEQVEFTVDEDGIDNAMIYPINEADDAYRARIKDLMGFAAQSGAAMGFSLKPKNPLSSMAGQRYSNIFRRLFGLTTK